MTRTNFIRIYFQKLQTTGYLCSWFLVHHFLFLAKKQRQLETIRKINLSKSKKLTTKFTNFYAFLYCLFQPEKKKKINDHRNKNDGNIILKSDFGVGLRCQSAILVL